MYPLRTAREIELFSKYPAEQVSQPHFNYGILLEGTKLVASFLSPKAQVWSQHWENAFVRYARY